MSGAPLPSRLILLQNLPRVQEGSKVRFLGCVSSYDSSTSRLSLQHEATASAVSMDEANTTVATGLAQCKVIASVDTVLLAETIRESSTSIGAWVSVIGYVERLSDKDEGGIGENSRGNTFAHSDIRKAKGKRKAKDTETDIIIKVQALMLWEAGAVDLERYEKAVVGRMEMD